MIRFIVAAALTVFLCGPASSEPQNVLTDEQYLTSLDDAASSCAYFVALNHLLNYDPAIAEDVVRRTCADALDRFDREGCRLEAGPDEPQVADCVAAKIYSEVTVVAAVNLMRMVDEARKR